MIETGYIALVIAIVVAVVSIIATIIGIRSKSDRLIASARIGVLTVAVLYSLALAIILYSYATKDFSLKIVSDHASSDLPLGYSLSAIYADKTGSFFFWGWLIAIFAAILAVQKRDKSQQETPYALIILLIIEFFFLSLTTLVTNIFTTNQVLPPDGFGLNPLLQNVAMFVHPTLLYLGFAGFAIVFALGLAALITRQSGTDWIVGIRRWVLIAWCMLGIGNLMGMWWAYIELGWGGYWAWDPVENAGLMPWLLGTALLHSIAMRRQRDYLHKWSLALIFFTFAFTLLSPFITHGGIESPLHGFQNSKFPPYILSAILISLIVSLSMLYVYRRCFQDEKKPSSLISREGAFLITNIILVVLTLVILIGTVLPAIINALGGADSALERSFFDRTCGPIMLILVFLMGICPLAGWGKTAWSSVKKHFLFAFPITLVISVIILITRAGNWYAVIPPVCGFPLYVILAEWFRGIQSRRRSYGENPVKAFFSILNNRRARYGGFIVHISIVIIALGITGSSIYSVEKTTTLDINQSMRLGKYELTYRELTFQGEENKLRAVAEISVTRDGKAIETLYPELDYWFRSENTFAEVDYHSTLGEDIFLSLAWTGFDPQDKSATFRALINPLIIWIWIGGGLFLLGGILSFSLPGNRLERIK